MPARRLSDGTYYILGRSVHNGFVSVTFPRNPELNGYYRYDDHGYVIVCGESVPFELE